MGRIDNTVSKLWISFWSDTVSIGLILIFAVSSCNLPHIPLIQSSSLGRGLIFP